MFKKENIMHKNHSLLHCIGKKKERKFASKTRQANSGNCLLVS